MKLTCITFIMLFLISCGNGNENTTRMQGVIQQQGITSYQYGTHTLNNEESFYALKSEKIDLDQYVDKEVVIQGRLIHEGLSGGPEYYEVVEIKE